MMGGRLADSVEHAHWTHTTAARGGTRPGLSTRGCSHYKELPFEMIPFRVDPPTCDCLLCLRLAGWSVQPSMSRSGEWTYVNVHTKVAPAKKNVFY